MLRQATQSDLTSIPFRMGTPKMTVSGAHGAERMCGRWNALALLIESHRHDWPPVTVGPIWGQVAPESERLRVIYDRAPRMIGVRDAPEMGSR